MYQEDPTVFILDLEFFGKMFYENCCLKLIPHITPRSEYQNDYYSHTAYLIYQEITTQIFDFFLDIPGGVSEYEFMEKVRLLPNMTRVIGYTMISQSPVLTRLLTEETKRYAINLFQLLKYQGFLTLSSLYVINFDCQMTVYENLNRLVLVRLPEQIDIGGF